MRFLPNNFPDRLISLAIFIFIITPVLVIMILNYVQAKQNLTAIVLQRREAIASLTASRIQERFERLTDIGISFATRVQFRKLIADGKWDEAIVILKDVPKDFSFIERLALITPDGTVKGLNPTFPGIVGQNFSHRDWYQGVSKNWQPYISEVFKGATNQNSIVIATPIFSEENKILGILNIQVLTDTVLNWTKEVEVGKDTLIYIVDQKGHLVIHPKFDPQGQIVDFSSVPAVQKALSGKNGVELLYNPVEKIERVTAYQPIPKYGWAAIVAQSEETAFTDRDVVLRNSLLIFAFLFVLTSVLAYIVVRNIFKLRQANVKLQELDKLKDEFVSIASHELRTPMTAISGFVDMIKEGRYGEVNKNLNEPLTYVADSTDRLISLVNDMLDVSRIESGRLKFNLTDINLENVIKDVILILEPVVIKEGVKLEVGKIEKQTVLADVDKVKQILNNLIGNSLKFTDKGNITVYTETAEGLVKIFIKDTGLGIKEDDIDKLFGKFQQITSSQSGRPPGTGLGLYLSRELTRKMGGDLWLESSEIKKGSIFAFSLPLTKPS